MFQEDLARTTADHLRGHIADYLAWVTDRFPDDQVKLVVPKSIEVASAVGGLWQEFDRILPMYGIDIWGKTFSVTVDNLNTWEYVGQISGLLSSNSRTGTDKLVRRHAAAVERFFQQHARMHESYTDDFKLLSLVFIDTEFSGAEYLGELNNREYWIGGFSFDCIWTTSEDPETQHG